MCLTCSAIVTFRIEWKKSKIGKITLSINTHNNIADWYGMTAGIGPFWLDYWISLSISYDKTTNRLDQVYLGYGGARLTHYCVIKSKPKTNENQKQDKTGHWLSCDSLSIQILFCLEFSWPPYGAILPISEFLFWYFFHATFMKLICSERMTVVRYDIILDDDENAADAWLLFSAFSNQNIKRIRAELSKVTTICHTHWASPGCRRINESWVEPETISSDNVS